MVIYGLTDPRNDKIYYVGATSNFKGRMEDHVRDVPTDHWAPHLSQEEVDSLERERYTFHSRKKKEIYNAGVHTIVQILDYAESYEAAQELETAYIRKYVPGQADSAGIREPSYPFVPPPTPPEPAPPTPPPPEPEPDEPDAIDAEYTIQPAPLTFAEWLAAMPTDLSVRDHLAILELAKGSASKLRNMRPTLYHAVSNVMMLWSQLITAVEKELRK
jgi:hypothetical protein